MKGCVKMTDEIKDRYNRIWKESFDKRLITYQVLCGKTQCILQKWDGTTWGGMPQYDTVATFSWLLRDEEIIKAIQSITGYKESDK